MSDLPKFITDATLGKLAKWLKLLGYNTRVFPKEAGREMLRLAQSEGRIVLTRRADMAQRQFSGCLYLLTKGNVASQLKDVINKFSLSIKKQNMFVICLRCNEHLQAVSAQEVRDLVPPYVYETCASFNRCPICKRIYWEGTHKRNSLLFLDKNKIIIN